GMKAIRSTDDKIVAATKVHPGSIATTTAVKETVDGITDIYHNKGYLDAKVTEHEILQPDNTATMVFDVSEGPEVRISDITFSGNKEFSDRQLRAVMDTATHNILSFIFNTGTLDEKKLSQDQSHIQSFYYDNGYLNVAVSQPQVTRVGNDIKIHFNIDEGIPYRFGRVALTGNLRFPRSELIKLITIKRGERFQGSVLQHNQLVLSDYYSNRGYAYVNVNPRTRLDATAHRIDVTFVINPGHEVLVNRINITGNTKTADKVIRREMQLQEQAPYSAEAIRESQQRLTRLGFFSDVRITTEPSSQPDKVNINVNVTEGNTAALQV